MAETARARTYLLNLAATLRDAGNTATADIIERANEEIVRSQWCEMTDHLLLAIRDPMVLESAYDLHENVLRITRMDMSNIAYVMLLHSICFSPHSTLQKSLELLDGAAISLSSNSSEQGEHAAQCIRALLLLESSMNSENPVLSAGVAQHQARLILDKVENFIQSKQMHEVEPVLAALHCQARGKDYEIRRQYTNYFKNAFETVNSAERAEMRISDNDMLSLAFKTAIAALLSEDIFNFGKLLNEQHFTQQLANSPANTWLLEWLRLCNDGKVEEFEHFAQSHHAQINALPSIVSAAPAIARKVRLMALLHLVFYTPFNQRTFTFDVIARRCAVEEDRVEPLLLAALAKGIVIGKIDGLTSEVHITWVEPRVLSLHEVKELATHVSQWKEKVLGLSTHVAKFAQEISK